MPNSLGEWGFWIFSTIIVGLIIGIGVNLITPRIKDTGQGLLQKRRLSKQKYTEHLEKLSDRLITDPASVYLLILKRLLGISTIAIPFLFLGFLMFVRPFLSSAEIDLFNYLSGSTELIEKTLRDKAFDEILLLFMGIVLLVSVISLVSAEASFVSDLLTVHSDRVGRLEATTEEMVVSTQTSHAQEEGQVNNTSEEDT